jgi:hypothetical protein
MSDEWNQNSQQNQWHTNDQPQHDQNQGWQQPVLQQQEFQPEHQHFGPSHEPVVVAASPAPTLELARLDAIEAAIQELRAHIDDLKSSLQAPAAPAVELEPTPAPTEATAADPHADRLAGIEQEISHIRTLIGAVAHTVSDLHTDVKANADLNAETRGIVDDQHQLMRGLNYIITSAIGTLTASAKSVK